MTFRSVHFAARIALACLLLALGCEGILGQPAAIKILPLGDSLTRGNNDINYPNGDIPGGYRKELGSRLGQAGVAFDFIGSRNDNAAAGMDPHHEGEPGARTDEILTNFNSYTAAAADTVLLMAGTNDILQNIPVATAAANLNKLILQITHGAPARKLYVATIPPITQAWPPQNPQYTAAYLDSRAKLYNTELRGLVQQHANQGRKVTLVDMNQLIVLTDANPANRFYQPGDGIHPGQAGYHQLGTLWFNAINPGPPAAGVPALPGGFTVTVTSPSRINLRWTDLANNETSYQIRRRTGVDGEWEIIATLPANTSHHAVTGLATGANSYGFSVRASNLAGSSEWTGTVFSNAHDDKAHLKASSASASYDSSTLPARANDGNLTTLWASTGVASHYWQVDLGTAHHIQRVSLVTRQDNSNVEAQRKNFEIRASNDPSFGTYSVLGVQGNTAIPHQGTWNGDVTVSTPFRYVRAAKTDNQSFSIALFKVLAADLAEVPETPLSLTGSAVDSDSVAISWTIPSDNESGFKLERKDGANGVFTEIQVIPAAVSTWLYSGLDEDVTYRYRLRATNEAGDSPYSNEAAVTTSGLSAYETWAERYPEFLALPANDRLPSADPNGDGVNNLLAYAMAADPLEQAPLPYISVSSVLLLAAEFRFRRNKSAPDLIHEVLVSGDPGAENWSVVDQSSATFSDLPDTPWAEEVVVPLPSNPGSGSLFVRLRVVKRTAAN